VATARGVEGSLYYLFVYTFMVIGSFAVVTVIGGPGDRAHDLDRYRGLAARRPWLAGSLGVLLMAQAGIPFTTGFLAKLEVISASVGGRSTALAVIAMVSAAIAAFFYLRVILLMYSPAAPAGAAASAGAPGASPSADGAPEGPDGAPEPAPTLTLLAESAAAVEPAPVGATTATAITLCVVVTVLFGLWPAPLVDLAHQATLLFR